MKIPYLCSGQRYGWTDMQHDLFRSSHDLDLRSNFQDDLLMSNYISFDASRQEKHDAGKINVVALLSQQLLQKNYFRKKRLFLKFLLSGGQTVDLWWNLKTCQRKNGKRAIECVFFPRCNSSGSRVMCQFVEQCWNRQNLTFGDLWWVRRVRRRAAARRGLKETVLPNMWFYLR